MTITYLFVAALVISDYYLPVCLTLVISDYYLLSVSALVISDYYLPVCLSSSD